MRTLFLVKQTVKSTADEEFSRGGPDAIVCAESRGALAAILDGEALFNIDRNVYPYLFATYEVTIIGEAHHKVPFGIVLWNDYA